MSISRWGYIVTMNEELLRGNNKNKTEEKIKLLNRPEVSKYRELKYTNTHRKNEVTTKEKKNPILYKHQQERK